MPVQRINNLSRERFCADFLAKNEPVIITDSLESWCKKDFWSFQQLSEKFGDMTIQVYNDVFDLKSLISLREYIEEHIGKTRIETKKEDISYARLYSKFKDLDFVWSDELFQEIEKEWAVPQFVPEEGYVFPLSNSKISPVTHRFPARVLFISPGGARTSNHVDPWCSDAILCQIKGRKEIIFFRPDQFQYLISGNHIVDIDMEDKSAFPEYAKAEVAYKEILNPGEVVFIPNGWFHHVRTLDDSISLSWNFLHSESYVNPVTTQHSCFKDESDEAVRDYFVSDKFLE
jgi:hypothetical protein